MQESNCQTLTVQPLGSTTPTTIAKASATTPLRVLLSNVGPVMIFVSTSVTDLQPQPTTSTYRVSPGQSPAFVLAPRQSLYAVGAAAGGLLSVTSSAALPAGA